MVRRETKSNEVLEFGENPSMEASAQNPCIQKLPVSAAHERLLNERSEVVLTSVYRQLTNIFFLETRLPALNYSKLSG